MERPSGSSKTKTVLQSKLETLARDIGRVGFFAGASCTLILSASFTQRTFLGGLGAGDVATAATWEWAYLNDYVHFFIQGVTIVVVAVPEGLPLAVTLALAFSVRRMLDDNNLVRYLGACETMGGATTILSDKTGTLTRNEMTVSRVWAAGRSRGPFLERCVEGDVGCLSDTYAVCGCEDVMLQQETAIDRSLRFARERWPDESLGSSDADPNETWIDPDSTWEDIDVAPHRAIAAIAATSDVGAEADDDARLWRELANAICVNSTARFTVVDVDEATGEQKGASRPISHWSSYDRVRVVNFIP